MTEPRSNQGWRTYWRENRLAACMPDNPGTAAAIEAHWGDMFSALPAGSRVLDVATGNGVLLVWAARAARAAGRELALTGVDLADIDPARFLPEQRADLASVRFVGNVAAESLPFADGSFDRVVSQYGMEYADLDRALGEAARVLAPGGSLHWLAHAEDSGVVAEGRARLADIDLLLAPDGPFAAMKNYLEAHRRRRKLQRTTRELTDALRAAEAHCAANPPAVLAQQLCGAILDTANQLQKYHPADAAHWLEENRKRLLGLRQRTRDLLSASLDGTRLARVERILAASPWADATLTAFRPDPAGRPVGRLVQASRR